MALVFIHKDFAPQLSLAKRKWIAHQFAEYQDAPDELCGDVFGRDKANTQPNEAVSLRIHHTHMVTEEVEDSWFELVRRGAKRHEYTSDQIVMYARLSPFGTRHDVYLLLEHYEAPGGHVNMREPNVYPELCRRVRSVPQTSCGHLKTQMDHVDTKAKRKITIRL